LTSLWRFTAALVAAAFLGATGSPRPREDCASLHKMIARTYDFFPSKLTDKQIEAKSAMLDLFWDSVKARPAVQLPCLRAAIADTTTNTFFRFDASNLLLTLDSSNSAKQLQIAAYTSVDLADVQPATWVSTLAMRGFEGFNTTTAAERWLRLPEKDASYSLAAHGGYVVTQYNAALFLYGAMPESLSTPALVAVVGDVHHPGRETAFWLLSKEATPAARAALVTDSGAPMSENNRKQIREFLTHPPMLTPSAHPVITRAEFVAAFEAIRQTDNFDLFYAIRDRAQSSESDAAAVMLPEDIPLLRWVRRRWIAVSNQHALEYYADLTGIIRTVEARPKSK
jgi:hypothetical protein